ncbi:MAG: UDP-glucose 4-epimerase GalE [Candidatus Tantalella remota]|nr:UDP-glucose 4-epimerase GalE [Candidatus Tantalella remota]
MTDMKKTILVTGGAGYIGSVMARELLANGYDVVVLDSFIKGRRFTVERNAAFAEKQGRKFILEEGDLGDIEFLREAFTNNDIEAVIHFAAFAEVGESVKHPGLYFYNNIINTVHLLDSMAAAGVKRIVFSSSCAVYGRPASVPIKEDCLTHPINPYGYTKLAMERMIGSYKDMYGIEWVALRYFNAAGASLDGELGESHYPESHLIPNAIDWTVKGQKVKVFGNDYDTEDGTCLRDYISIVDLARAHRIALEMPDETINRAYNLGSGSGFTVDAVVKEVGRALGVEAVPEHVARRPGDPDKLLASSHAFIEASGWELKDSSIKDILRVAVDWYKNRPEEALEPKPLPDVEEKEIVAKIHAELDENLVIPQSVKKEILENLEKWSRS